MSGLGRVFVDTNVFVASLTDEPERGSVATDLLNAEAEFYTSLLNLMELRTVLAKKKQVEQDRVEDVIRRISRDVRVAVHEPSDVIVANRRQRDDLLYPMDALVVAIAEDQDARLATFDGELLDAGATRPETLLG